MTAATGLKITPPYPGGVGALRSPGKGSAYKVCSEGPMVK